MKHQIWKSVALGALLAVVLIEAVMTVLILTGTWPSLASEELDETMSRLHEVTKEQLEVTRRSR